MRSKIRKDLPLKKHSKMEINNKKILLIGWDAADWKFLTPLMDKGLMPNLSRLVEGGVKGRLATLDPPLSPTLWTSIATGKRPYKHGIHGFAEKRPDGKGIRPIYNTNRKVKAIWNILSERKLKSNIVSWWPSHPAEKINGIMVSNFYQRANNPIHSHWPILNGTIFPKEKEQIFEALRVHPGELTEAHILPFVPNAIKVDQQQDSRLQTIAKITADCASVQSAATYMLENEEWDFTAAYFDGIDHYCHGFMKYHPPYRPHIRRGDFELYKEVVNGACIYHDMMLGRLMNLAGANTNIILISDHGFYPDHNRPINLPTEPAGPAYEHSPYGIIVMNGPDIKKDELIYGASLLDITPTILHIYGLPVGQDMDGKVLSNAFCENSKIDFIESWEFGKAFQPHSDEIISEEQEALELKQLIDLGYINDPGDDYKKAIIDTENENNFYLARSYFDGGKWEEGVEILEALYSKNPNEIRFGIRLLHGYLVIGSLRKARQILSDLKVGVKIDVMELQLMEGTLFLAENKPKRALEILKKLKEEVGNNSSIDLKVASALVQLNNFSEAEDLLISIIEHDPECNEALFKLGFCHYHTGNYAGAINCFLDAIGLSYYSPNAHYYLAEALLAQEKYVDAAEAFEVCVSLAPGMNIARERLISIYTQFLKEPGKALKYKIDFENKIKGSITIVSGLPRSGTSMMMQMLEAGGLEIYSDKERLADESNPKGYYEHEAVKSLAKNKKWLPQASGKSVKVIAQLLAYLPLDYQYKVIFMEREIIEVIQSQQKMLNRNGKNVQEDTLPLHLLDSYQKTINKVKAWAAKCPNVEIHFVNYKHVVENPFLAAININDFLDGNLIPEKMTQAVDQDLYREKVNAITL